MSTVADRPQGSAVDPFWTSSFFDKLQIVCWIAFVGIPIVTGCLAYNWLPNEAFSDEAHELLETVELEDERGLPVVVPALWKHKQTGVVYSREDFIEHRGHERNRMAVVWFAYGLVGCFFYAWSQAGQRRNSFSAAFGQAALVNVAVTFFMWLSR
jgi:hypothetical protein